MQIEYDKESDALYIRLKNGDVDDTQIVSQYVYVDVDEEGKPIGLEILFASHIMEDGFPNVTFNLAGAIA